MTDTDPTSNGAAGASPAPQFTIRKLYVKDLSFESPRAPQVFAEASAGPQLDFQLGTSATPLSGDDHEVVLSVTATARRGDETVFLVELKQAGVFQIRGVPAEQMEWVLAVACPNVLFPYARQVISDATLAGGFPPLLLAPVNFEVLHRRQQDSQGAAAPAQA